MAQRNPPSIPRDPFDRFEAICRANSLAYHAMTLGISVADVIEEPPSTSSSEPITVFHTRERIGMSLFDLACTMQRVTKCNDEAILVALTLACRYSHLGTPVSRHMMHRLFVACLQLGLKTHNDEFFTNAAYARVAGVLPAEMNRLELGLLKGLDWRCCVLITEGSTVALTAAAAASSAAVVGKRHPALSVSASGHYVSTGQFYSDSLCESMADNSDTPTLLPTNVAAHRSSPSHSQLRPYLALDESLTSRTMTPSNGLNASIAPDVLVSPQSVSGAVTCSGSLRQFRVNGGML